MEVSPVLLAEDASVSVDQSSSSSNSSSLSSSVDDDGPTTTSTTTTTKMVPRLQAQFSQLSSVLSETHDNLLTFEFMLGHVRQKARVAPMQAATTQSAGGDGDKAAGSEEKLQRLIAGLSEAVGRLAEMQQALPKGPDVAADADADGEQRLQRLQDESDGRQRENDALRTRIAELERTLAAEQSEQIRLKFELGEQHRVSGQLRESVSRARVALEEERSRSADLDQRLDRERVAARRVADDIQKYVAEMQRLEQELEAARASEKKLVNEDNWRAKCESEAAARREAEARAEGCEVRVGDYERQLAELKGGLEVLQSELERCQKASAVSAPTGSYSSGSSFPEKGRATDPVPKPVAPSSRLNQERSSKEEGRGTELGSERAASKPEATSSRLKQERISKKQEASNNSGQCPDCRATDSNEALMVEALRAELASTKDDLCRLKAKSKVLLGRYRQKRDACDAQSAKMARARQALLRVRDDWARGEANHRQLLDHLGAEIEIAARLMAAYLDVEAAHDPVRLGAGSGLAAWFGRVQALSTWLQAQLVAFGKRLWTSDDVRLPLSPPAPILRRQASERSADNTLSEITEGALIQDGSAAATMRETALAQDSAARERRRSLDLLISDMSVGV